MFSKLVALVLVVLVSSISCSVGDPISDVGSGGENLTVVQAADFHVENRGYGYSTTYIMGRLKNTSGRRLEYASVSCSVSRGGVQYATARDSTTNLASGHIWPYKAIIREDLPGRNYDVYCDTNAW